jgi:hypothetical protein
MKTNHIPQSDLIPGGTLNYTIIQPPKPVGYWVLYPQGTPHTQFAMYHKPTDEQIKNTEQLLGWGWKDEL